MIRCIIIEHRTTTCKNICKLSIFLQAHFERMFRDFEVGAAFHYLPSFRRIRVDFASHLSASKAKQHMESTIIGENTIHCYFIQVSIVSFCKCSRMLKKFFAKSERNCIVFDRFCHPAQTKRRFWMYLHWKSNFLYHLPVALPLDGNSLKKTNRLSIMIFLQQWRNYRQVRKAIAHDLYKYFVFKNQL